MKFSEITNRKILVKGLPGCSGIAVGKAHVIATVDELQQFIEGEILITEIVEPGWVPAIKKAAGIVMNGQSLVSRNIIREFRIPCVDGTRGCGGKSATEVILDGTIITVDGEAGIVYGDVKSEPIIPLAEDKSEIIERLYEDFYNKASNLPELFQANEEFMTLFSYNVRLTMNLVQLVLKLKEDIDVLKRRLPIGD